jgi:G3E family GTPase
MIPVLLVTGFLGSGKTTLLNRMLARKPADAPGRWALIVNELGTVGIDGELLPAGATRQIELASGCICCVLNEDLDRTILELLADTPQLELLVIETTGVAEPMPIAWSIEAEALAEHVRLAAVVTVVDAVNHERHRPESPAVDAQVEYADVLVISKIDELNESAPSAALIAELRGRNDAAPLVYGAPEQVADTVWRLVMDPTPRAAAPAGDGAHRHGDHLLETIAIPIERTLDYEELADALEELPTGYLRIKGIARVIDRSTGTDEPHYIAFHRVGARVSRERLEGRSHSPRMVALGRGLDRAALAACVEGAVVPCDAVSD